MLAKFFKYPLIHLLVVPCVLFFIFASSYSSFSKTIPVYFWDEILWVGRSYFFEFFIHGDFNDPVWWSYRSYDQPKLAEYAYGAWLYPLYLMDRKNNEKPFDYTRYLIKNGFYEIDEHYMAEYEEYRNNLTVINFDGRMYGFPEEWVTKYGWDSLKSINLIYYARILNIFFLAGAIIFAYFLALMYGKLAFAIIFSIFYGYNSLIIDTGLKAHSEALFLFTFNAALLLMNLYFTKGRKAIYLLLFSLFAGLCMSTKLNGSMLVIIFFILNSILFFCFKKWRIGRFLSGFLPMMISLAIFIILNPFTYPDPLKNTQYMFESRMKAAIDQAKAFSESSIPDEKSRVGKIFGNFYFSEQVPYFSGIRFLERLTLLKNYGIYLFVLFTLGLFYSIKSVFQKNKIAIVVLCSFILILGFMAYYLVLDWDRYYAHLPLFLVMFQTLGIFFVIKYVYKYSKLITMRAINRTRKNKRPDTF